MGKSKKRSREALTESEPASGDQSAQPAPPPKRSRIEAKRSLFIRSLPPSATAESLTEFFSQHYPVKHATVVQDPSTKQSRGYGFVTFTDADDAIEAKGKLNNELIDGRRIRLDIAEPRHRGAANGGAPEPATSRLAEEKKKREADLAEARKAPKLIVRNLPWSIKTSDQLATLFRSYGKVRFADLPQSKGKLGGFGFVTLRGRKNAEKAMECVNGRQVDGRTLAVDWAVDKKEWEKHQEEDANDEADSPAKPKGTDDATEGGADKATDDESDSEEDEDLKNFMKSHMDNLEDEDSDADSEGGADVDKDEVDGQNDGPDAHSVAKKPQTTDPSTTLFIRNLPFTATDEQVKAHFATFGAVRYARVVMDRATDRPAGTGFVCFFNADDAQTCLKGAPRPQPPATANKHSVLQDDSVDPEGNYTMDGRILQLAQAVSKDKATQLTADGIEARKGKEDKRRLYLLSEGTISKKSPLYASLAPSEIKMRDDSEAQRKKLVQTNPALHISLTRLAIRNMPRNVDSKGLKALARQAVVGFATDVKEGRRQPLSKEEVARAGKLDKEAEHHRKEKKRGVVKQAKVVFETRDGSKVSEGAGGGRSRCYGFIEYSTHRSALMGLRWLNGHAMKNDAGKTLRLIAEFAIENANVVSRRKTLEDRSRQKGPRPDADKKDANTEPLGEKVKGKKDKKGKPPSEKEGQLGDSHGSEDKTGDKKAALRQKIIGRKRLMRKKKADIRRSKA